MTTISAGEALAIDSLITATEQSIASRVLAKATGGSLTLFAFDEDQGLSEHSTPFDAFVIPLEGKLVLTIAGTEVVAIPGTIVRMPANVPHQVTAPEPARMLLLMLREVGRHDQSS